MLFRFDSISIMPFASQNTEPITFPIDYCSFGRFGRASPVAVHSDDDRYIHVSSIVTYRRINSGLLRLNMATHCSESSTRSYFRLAVRIRGTCFEQSFLMDKCSCHITPTRSFHILTMSANFRNFTLPSFKTILWIILKFSGVTFSLGHPMYYSSFVERN